MGVGHEDQVFVDHIARLDVGGEKYVGAACDRRLDMFGLRSFGIDGRIKIERAFPFQKTDDGRWRCNANALGPVDFGLALSGP